jgi:hypothetical protein
LHTIGGEVVDQEQLIKWRHSVEWFRAWYLAEYKHKASDKRVESYCNAQGIPWPIPREETEEEEEQIPPHVDISFGRETEDSRGDREVAAGFQGDVLSDFEG